MLLIFDLDDTLIHTHRIFVELTEEFLERMSALGFDDENVYYTMDAFDREIVEEANAYVPWAFPKAMRRTYEFYCEKCFADFDEQQADALEELGFGYKEADYQMVDGAKALLNLLADEGHTLVLLTQGGYEEQKYKVDLHNFGDYFDEIIVVDKKTPAVYTNIMQRHGFFPEETLVIGNSLKSEVAPALAVGARPILVRVTENWDFENIELDAKAADFPTAHSMLELAELLGVEL
jgi:putative hydrolase of the HAD superfamily